MFLAQPHWPSPPRKLEFAFTAQTEFVICDCTIEIEHRVLKEKVPWGLVPLVQARLLARHLRGDLKEYLPFIYK